MKITYRVWTKTDGIEIPTLLTTYKTKKAAFKFAYTHTKKFNIQTEVVEMIKERGEQPYGNLEKTYFPREVR